MKKQGITTFFLILITAYVFAQRKKDVVIAPEMPFDETTGLITYTGVIDTKYEKADNFRKGLAWFNSFYKNTRDVIKKKDADAGIIEGIARFRIFKIEKKDIKVFAGIVSYSIFFTASDNKCEYNMTRINWKQASHYPIKKWMDKKSPYYTTKYDYYLLQTDEYMKNLIKNLEKAIGT